MRTSPSIFFLSARISIDLTDEVSNMGLFYVKYGEKIFLLCCRCMFLPRESCVVSLLPVYILLTYNGLIANMFAWFILMYNDSVLKDINATQCNVIGQNVEIGGFKTSLYAHLHLHIPRFLKVRRYYIKLTYFVEKKSYFVL